MRFVIEDVLDAPTGWRDTPAHAELDADTAAQVLEEAAKFASEVLAPTNGPGDLEGCRWHPDGSVQTPAGYREAYRAFVDGGWPALPCDPEVDGQGLPQLLHAALFEMLASANHGWSMYPGLLHGAYECLHAHGSEELKAAYLPKVVSGEWLATMALTEPQAGSDLGLVRTRGEARPDGSIRVTGNKIFISGGEHDLTDNIVHLVLLRLDGAPRGTKGLSLALVPKVLPDGTRNGVRCDGIEKKMGIKGSATCVLAFEGATGWLIGAPNRGLAAMFVMMNSARLIVGLQGLGHLEMATQNAIVYAHERQQMRAARPVDKDPAPAGTLPDADPIARHPAVRRTLWRLRALTEGARVIAYRAAQAIDFAEHHPDAQTRGRAQALAGLLTPVVKAFLTDRGFHGAAAAQQVWGGYGYVHEYGIEQTVRDSRIAMIYEGTNEIQAIDLVQRKLLADGGAAWALLRGELLDEAERCLAVPALSGFAEAVRGQVAAIDAAVADLSSSPVDTERLLSVADDVLHGFGHALLAWAWAASARAAHAHAGEDWFDERFAAARFGVEWILPEAAPCWQRVAARSSMLPAAPIAD